MNEFTRIYRASDRQCQERPLRRGSTICDLKLGSSEALKSTMLKNATATFQSGDHSIAVLGLSSKSGHGSTRRLHYSSLNPKAVSQ
jgi:hypothetical protein